MSRERKREGNRPDRRVLPPEASSTAKRSDLAGRLRYVGSSNHKLRPGDYGLVPPNNPRPTKSPCDDLRPVLLDEAKKLFGKGIELGMFSRIGEQGLPKYVWSVDDAGNVYEAKAKAGNEVVYHGYRVGDDDKVMRSYILSAWGKRCKTR